MGFAITDSFVSRFHTITCVESAGTEHGGHSTQPPQSHSSRHGEKHSIPRREDAAGNQATECEECG